MISAMMEGRMLTETLILSSLGGCVCVCVCCSVMSDSAIPWTVVSQPPLSMVFSKKEYWSE